jgi:hypothetical protein
MGSPLVTRTIRGWPIVTVTFVAAAIGAFVLLLYLGRVLTFWHDEWVFFAARDGWSLETFMRPHNEHWILGMVALRKPLMELVGMSSHLPYLAQTLAFHVLTAAAVWRIATAQAGPLVGLASGILMLFLGFGYENVWWSFQVGFAAAAAAGAWAIASVLGRRRPWIAAVLLVIAVATSGPGLAFVAAIGALAVIVPDRRRQLVLVVLPAVISYGAWLLTFGSGRDAAGTIAGGLMHAGWLLDFVRFGIATALGDLSGVGTEIGGVLACLLIGGTLWTMYQGRTLEGAIMGCTGLVALFASIGIARPGGDIMGATAPRYIHIAAVFLLIAVTSLVGSRRAAWSAPSVAAVCVVFLCAIVVNIQMLQSGLRWFEERSSEVRAAITVLAEHRGAVVPASEPWLGSLPGRDAMRSLVDRYGSALDDAWLPGTVPIPDEVYQRVMALLLPGTKQPPLSGESLADPDGQHRRAAVRQPDDGESGTVAAPVANEDEAFDGPHGTAGAADHGDQLARHPAHVRANRAASPGGLAMGLMRREVGIR